MKKWKSLIIAVTILAAINSNAQLVLERTVLLSTYPSGSSIEFADNKFFVVGDDATHLMVLNSNYNKIDSVALFKGVGRISKNKKKDIEASSVVPGNGTQYLLLLGSSSTPRRKKALLYPFSKDKTIQTFSTKKFDSRLMKAGLKELNFEGLATTKNKLVIANRGHMKNATNQLIVTDQNFYSNQSKANIHLINIILDLPATPFAGVSGLTYDSTNDMMFFTASTENTSSTFGDGDITDSYIGWIKNFSSKTNSKEIIATDLINLSKNNQSFNKQKIESIAIQELQGNTYIVHLIADNDNGQTTLFNCRLTIK